MLEYIIARLKEASTWRGIVALLTAFGLKLSPELGESIVSAGLALIGLIGIFFKDKLSKNDTAVKTTTE